MAEIDKLSGLALKRARLVPSSAFVGPEAVVESTALSRAQKIEVLRRWEFDARRGAVRDVEAVEATSARDDADLLARIRAGLRKLGVRPPGQRSGEGDTRH